MDGCLRRVPVGEPRDGVCLQGTVRESGRRATELELLSFMGALLGERRGVKEGCGDGHFFPLGSHWKTWERVQLGNL